MNLDFDFDNVTLTEFGVGRDEDDGQTYSAVPVDSQVQSALREMATTTWNTMNRSENGPAIYQPSEKHGAAEYLYVPLSDELATSVRELHQANNLPPDTGALAEPANVFCYFARLTDKKGRRLTALRRATQFKGVLKSRLLRFADDTLKIVEDQVFKLDIDFDLLVDSQNVHILRPSAFEFAGGLQEAILAAVPKNVGSLKKDMTFVDFSGVQEYASKHPRAARYLASIHSQKETKKVDKNALVKLCQRTGVEIIESNGAISVDDANVMGFLEVLDRRRYELELVPGSPEQYRAASREKIGS